MSVSEQRYEAVLRRAARSSCACPTWEIRSCASTV